MKVARNYRVGGTVVIPPITDPEPPITQPVSNLVTIIVNFANTPTATTSFPKLKYNKSKAIIFEFDDNAGSVVTAYDKLKTTYYTDGCGNQKNYSLGLAVNGKNNFNNAEWGDNYPGKASYSQVNGLIPYGLDVMNHSYYHEPNGNYSNGTNITKNFRDLDDLVQEKYNGYKMNTVVVPTNYAGYQLAARDYGYLVGSSEGTFDGITPYPSEWNPLGSISGIPKQNYTAIKRTFSDNWTSGGVQWSTISSFFSSTTADYFEIGTHGIDQNVGNFNSWIDSIAQQANDRILFQSLRELMEYKHVKENVTKSEQITGNSMKITLDYSSVPNQHISWYDLSLLVDSSQSITSVSIDNTDFNLSYNSSAKLININRRRTKW